MFLPAMRTETKLIIKIINSSPTITTPIINYTNNYHNCHLLRHVGTLKSSIIYHPPPAIQLVISTCFVVNQKRLRLHYCLLSTL